jgi:intracellular sulfur oxidation DsrE/DsrF family protein
MQPNTDAHHAHAIRNATALSAALAFCLALAFPASSYATADAQPKAKAVAHKKAIKKSKVVFQVSDGDPAKWNLALNNIHNVQDALGKDNVEVELVAYGPGIDMLKAEALDGNRVNDAVATGVKVVACEVTMHAQKLTKDDMLASIGYVPGGVLELMKREKEGWAYIRP